MKLSGCASAAVVALLGFSFTALAQQPATTLVNLARQEGRVIWYTTIAIPEGQAFIKFFEQRYPFLKVEMVRSGAGPMVNRILSEYTAGRHIVDVIHGVSSRGVLPYFQEKEIITSYDSPERRFIADDLKDRDGYWVSLYALPFVLIVNKNLVKAEDVPKSYEDLLHPKWKGKKILNDTENYAWFDGLLNYWGKDKGTAFFRKLAQQEQGFQRGARLRVQLVAAGEFPMTIGFGPHAQDYISKNAPIDWIPLEPVVFNVSSLSLAKRAPHPHAAKLFMDFLLSKEMQTRTVENNNIPVRVDVDPKPRRLFRDYKRIRQNIGDLSASINLYKEIFGLRE
ncbi:MAG: extracellular solute-binding protein [Deltaproteobacteria bacterium]|nr:extracellular solute-binding protein [Deltaproteobacteria bacterium]